MLILEFNSTDFRVLGRACSRSLRRPGRVLHTGDLRSAGSIPVHSLQIDQQTRADTSAPRASISDTGRRDRPTPMATSRELNPHRSPADDFPRVLGESS